MNPSNIGKAYDQITHLWGSDKFNRENGIEAHKRAIAFTKNRGAALDVGCGCTGRLIDLLLSNKFTPEGVDVSEKMVKLARKSHPEVKFHQQDICEWSPSQKYDFITAWDSIWHIPLDKQANVISKLVNVLNLNGIMIFSFGGVNEPGDHTDDTMGPMMYYSSLGTNGFIQVFLDNGCTIKHLEFDQHPELHTYIVAQRIA